MSKIFPQMLRKFKPFSKIDKIKRFLKQVKLVTNITFNSIKLIKNQNSLKNRRTRNKL